LTDSSESDASYIACQRKRRSTKTIETSHLSQRVENLIEEQQYLTLGHFGYIVHALARVVPHSRILVGEACEHRRHNFTQVRRNSFRAQCNRGSSQPDQASIAGMGLVHGVRVVVAELFNDFLYFLLLSSENSIADNFLKPSANEQ
jgi:hypothetical protein